MLEWFLIYIYIYIILSSILFLILFPTNTFASETVSLSVSSNTVNLDISSANLNGTFKKSSPITISAATSNLTGYTLSIAATNATNSNKLVHTSDHTSALNSITDVTTEATYSALNNTNYNNTFGYLPSKYASSPNTDFRPAPSVTGDILERTTTPNTTTNNYTLAIGARIDSTTKVGSYANTYIVRLIANTIPYSITYNDNVVSNMPVDTIGNASSTTVPISSTVPTRAGYIFKGWCSTVPTEGGSFCPGTTYQPASNYNLTSQSNDLTLYAMWGGSFDQAYSNAGKTKVTVGSNSYYALQDMNQEICNAVSQDETTLVVDTRDNQLYHIGKLKDNHCWTLDNLALDLINTDIANLKGKTNASDIALEYLKGTRTGTKTDQYPTAGITTFTSANNYSIPNMISSGTCYDSNCVNNPTTGNWTKDSVLLYSIGAIPNSMGYNKIGIYYNYCAASAGTYCWGNGTSFTGSPETDPYSDTLIDIDGDICPKGWRMPTGDSGGEYQALYSAYSSNYTDFRRALSTPLSGLYLSGSARYHGTGGNFWSSTWKDTGSMRNLGMDTSNIYPSDDSRRLYGFSVRCIVK